MDIQTIDNQYNQLQSQAQATIGELKGLAQKLQAAAGAGNQEAREWFLDLKSIALAIQAEQNQVANLLQALHNFVNAQQTPASVPQAAPQSPWGGQPSYPPQPNYPPQGYPQPGYPQPGYGGYPQQGGGLLGSFLNSGFGRAIEMGAGFGIGEEIIDQIF